MPTLLSDYLDQRTTIKHANALHNFTEAARVTNALSRWLDRNLPPALREVNIYAVSDSALLRKPLYEFDGHCFVRSRISTERLIKVVEDANNIWHVVPEREWETL